MNLLKIPVSSRDHIEGDVNASIIFLEYGDYECCYCDVARPIIKRLRLHFGKEFAFVFRHFPLPDVHPNATMAAEMAEFAATYDLFWEAHQLLYEYRKNLKFPVLLEIAKTLGLSPNDLHESLKNGTYKARVQSDVLSGKSSGVSGTPTFFINGKFYSGLYEYGNLIATIKEVVESH